MRLCCRTERPKQLLPVLLCEHSVTSLLSYKGTSRPVGQVRTVDTISHHACVLMFKCIAFQLFFRFSIINVNSKIKIVSSIITPLSG